MITPKHISVNRSLLGAAVEQGKAGADDSTIALAIDLLRSRQLARPDVRQKLAAIEERNRYRKSRGAR